VIILADGRFHEKDDLKKVAMDVTSRPGVMYAYIILDSPKNSILDMQSVSFGSDGKPLFKKYIDSFPFPLYTVVQDIHHLPRALAHLVRQWIEYTSHSM
jgi:midasin